MPAALVTGSAKGIGRALVLMLAEEGYNVAVHYHKSQGEAQEVTEKARGHGVEAITLQADVTDAEQAATLVKEAHAQLGGLDVLINNVGDYLFTPLNELEIDDWHAMFDSNLHSTFYTCRAAVPLMRERGGRIINLGYAGAELIKARPSITAYSIAKTGVILYSKALAKVEAKHGVTVNVLSPGIVENSVSVPDNIPMDRAGTFDEITSAAKYLISPGARYVTGVTLEVAGGWNV